ncbi:aspartic proteinase CDR1-like [Ananas comosus]|uniref:Aspartic proteinase CDR1-like n=1 Tax=Ananas comosus TaxID=4615 RepID=A0A6P5GTX6_ANACO|nr:aspartic proteinase CDR1-like [Ananas comosus]
MAKTIYSHLTFLLAISIPLISSATPEPLQRSLSFKLIYRDSPESPTYNPNLTKSQRFEESLRFSENRLIQLNNSQSMPMGYEITSIRSAVIYHSALYMVFVTIGTGNGTIGYYLNMDTSSGLTWTQCKPCNYHCINSLCHYEIAYADGSHTSGTLSKDTFGFRSSHGDHFEFVNGLIFGCSHNSHLVASNHGYPSGIMALGLSGESFARQLINHGSQARFSYCLPPIGSVRISYLRFGNNIVQRGVVQTTPIVPAQGVHFHYIILNDISVGTKRVGFEPQMFSRKPNGSGGFFVDSSTLVSRLITPAFELVKKVLRSYFRHRNLVEVDPHQYGISFKSCWLFQPGYEVLMPTMTLHLQGAEMSIASKNVFYIEHEKGLFCFAILPLDNLSILGAYQQVNTRFTYDVLHSQLAFNPEDCEHDSH